MPLLRSLPQNASLADLRSRFAELLDKLRPYAEHLMRGPSPLRPGERELIAAYVSGINSCRYCHGVHSQVAGVFGIEISTFDNLMANVDDAPVKPNLKPLLKYVRKLTETPSRMTDHDAAAVYDAGWSDEALFHAVAICAYFNQMNRLVDGTGIIGSAEAYAQAASRLATSGYAGDRQAR